MQKFRRIRRTIAALLLGLYLPGCYSWKAVPVSPVVAEQHPSKVRVTVTGGQRMELRGTTVAGDTLRGSRFYGARRERGVVIPEHEEQVAISVADVLRVEIRKFSTGKTVGLSILGAVALGSVALEFFCRPRGTGQLYGLECTR